MWQNHSAGHRGGRTRGVSTRGFSLIEVIVAMAILLSLFALSMPFLFSFHTRGLLDDAAEQLSQDIRRAQALAIAGVGKDGPIERDHGICFSVSNGWWFLFNAPWGPEKVIEAEGHQLPPSVTFASVETGHMSDPPGCGPTPGVSPVIMFRERTGRPWFPATIVLRAGDRQVTITVNAVGRVAR